MEIGELVGSILIVNIPKGEAPEKVRRAWVGLELPCLFVVDDDTDTEEVLRGKPITPGRMYIVPQNKAIQALERNNPEAGQWWRERGYPEGDAGLFSFEANYCAIEVKPVSSREEFVALMNRMMKAS